MKKNIIAISREFGSGGRTIGKLVAEKLGIEFYDKDIIKKVAEESGLTRKYVEHYGEFAPSSDQRLRILLQVLMKIPIHRLFSYGRQEKR